MQNWPVHNSHIAISQGWPLRTGLTVSWGDKSDYQYLKNTVILKGGAQTTTENLIS